MRYNKVREELFARFVEEKRRGEERRDEIRRREEATAEGSALHSSHPSRQDPVLNDFLPEYAIPRPQTEAVRTTTDLFSM